MRERERERPEMQRKRESNLIPHFVFIFPQLSVDINWICLFLCRRPRHLSILNSSSVLRVFRANHRHMWTAIHQGRKIIMRHFSNWRVRLLTCKFSMTQICLEKMFFFSFLFLLATYFLCLHWIFRSATKKVKINRFLFETKTNKCNSLHRCQYILQYVCLINWHSSVIYIYIYIYIYVCVRVCVCVCVCVCVGLWARNPWTM